jgi:hypothetical protein
VPSRWHLDVVRVGTQVAWQLLPGAGVRTPGEEAIVGAVALFACVFRLSLIEHRLIK